MRVERRPTTAPTVGSTPAPSTGKVLAFATREELGGVEFLGGVPGTVGGGMIMNAGTYLGEFKDVTVRGRTPSTSRASWSCATTRSAAFAIATRTIPRERRGHRRAAAAADRGRAPRSKQAVRELRDRRKAREPHGVPNAGSIFKNPPERLRRPLIEACGLKGRRVGGAEVSPAHANWLVNAGGATATDLLALVEIVRAAVVERFGITLELEVKVVGEDE